jgi:hypothetical protein
VVTSSDQFLPRQVLPGHHGSALAQCALTLARHFDGGGTLWCVAPGWEEHARHVAVEFVHPVVVGKRALPAVALGGPDAVSELRLASRPGDAVLFIGSDDEERIADVAERARCWGLMAVWLRPSSAGGPSGGPHNRSSSAHYVLDLDAPDGLHGRGPVLAYHLLWELTHVCLEHPGLLLVAPVPGEERCAVCSDEGRPGEVVFCDGIRGVARSERGLEEFESSLVGPLPAGSTVLIHGGVAISTVEGSRP